MPAPTIDDVIASVDLIELATQAGSHIVKSGRGWQGNCPIHRGKNRSGFSIYLKGSKQYWRCWSGECGGGDAIDFIKKINDCDFARAMEILTGGGPLAPDPQAAIKRAEQARIELEESIAKAQNALAELKRAQIWIKFHENLETQEGLRQLWRDAGVPDTWQDIWRLGYDPDFAYMCREADELQHSPTMTIPIFGPAWEPINVRHRLLKPYNPKDKYRPHYKGLHPAPFICDPDAGYSLDHVLVVEGEKKAMVTYTLLDSPKWQVIGIPAKTAWCDNAERLSGHLVWVCFDPDGLKEARNACNDVDGRIIELPAKIDDIILSGGLNQGQLRNLIKRAQPWKNPVTG